MNAAEAATRIGSCLDEDGMPYRRRPTRGLDADTPARERATLA
jgi:hypothetical protein